MRRALTAHGIRSNGSQSGSYTPPGQRTQYDLSKSPHQHDLQTQQVPIHQRLRLVCNDRMQLTFASLAQAALTMQYSASVAALPRGVAGQCGCVAVLIESKSSSPMLLIVLLYVRE